MVHLPKLPSQFKNLFWNFRVVGVVVFPHQFIHLLLYLFAVIGDGISPALTTAQDLLHLLKFPAQSVKL